MTDEVIRSEVTAAVRADFVRLNKQAIAMRNPNSDKPPPEVEHVPQPLVSKVVGAVMSLRMIADDVEQPTWIDAAGRPDTMRPAPGLVVAFPNGLLSLPAYAAGREGAFTPATPAFFNAAAMGFEFDLAPAPPTVWLDFLSRSLADDPESVGLLQEWFGYCLTPDTTQHKMLWLIGEGGSGKGTILRVQQALHGPHGFASTNFAALNQQFGCASLAGKTLAHIADAEIDKRNTPVVALERIKNITGGDPVPVEKKNKDEITATLPVRFTLAGNRLPELYDDSAALVRRLLLIPFRISFEGRKDPTLSARIISSELPGIFKWAAEGWRRLNERGRFEQPANGAILIDQFRGLSAPHKTFVRDRCATCIKKECLILKSKLFAAWLAWCEERGLTYGTAAEFGREIAKLGYKEYRPRDPNDSTRQLKSYGCFCLADNTQTPESGEPGTRQRNCTASLLSGYRVGDDL